MTEALRPTVTAAGAPLAEGALLARIAGGTASDPLRPWGGAAPVGPEQWANSIPWTVAGNSTSQSLLARVQLAHQFGVPTDSNVYRVEFELNAVPPSSGFGALSLTIAGANLGGDVLGDTLTNLFLVSAESPATTGYASGFEIAIPPLVGIYYLDFRLVADNTAPDGSITVTSMSVRQIDRIRRYLNVGNLGPGGPLGGSACEVDIPTTKADGSPIRARQELRSEGDLDASLFSLVAITEAGSLSASGVLGPFPAEVATLHLNNSDQIFMVYKDDDLTEYRGNTHGGETGRSGTDATDYEISYDIGDGEWRLLTDYSYGHRARRVKFVCNTKVTRSDASSPFANVDHTWVIYDDGTIRLDRTTTFLTDQKMGQYIYWMTSYPTGNELVGRLGNGDTAPIGSVDYTGPADGNTASSQAQWALYREPVSGVVFGHLLDLVNAKALPETLTARTVMVRGAGLEKIYMLLDMEGGMPHVVPAGSVFTSTLWHVIYQPESATEWHREGAIKGAAVQVLGDLYPVA